MRLHDKRINRLLVILAVVGIVLGIIGLGGYKVYSNIHSKHVAAQEIASEDTPTTENLDGVLNVTLPCEPTSYNLPSAIVDTSALVTYQTTCGLQAANSSGDIFTVTSNDYLANASTSINEDFSNCNPSNLADPSSFKSETLNGVAWLECVTQSTGGTWSTWAMAENPSNRSEDALIEVVPGIKLVSTRRGCR